jgi:uncharacterized protein YxeA
MKKMMITLAMIVTIGSMSAFAREENVSEKVLIAFSNDFNSVKEVEWTAGSNYYRAAFTFNGNHVFAFYNADGDLLGLTRYISSLDLPMYLQSGLKKSYSDYWISDLFEVANNDGTNYYITLENADSKIVLKATGGSDWKTYKKIRKA